MRDGHSSESVSFTHGPSARNSEGVNQEMVGSAGASYELAGVENLEPSPAPAQVASGPPPGRLAVAAKSRNAARAQMPSGVGFSGAPEDNPLFSGPNSKTIDVP
jgi:hypothetical protein